MPVCGKYTNSESATNSQHAQSYKDDYYHSLYPGHMRIVREQKTINIQ